jgi:hypothetical protein
LLSVSCHVGTVLSSLNLNDFGWRAVDLSGVIVFRARYRCFLVFVRTYLVTLFCPLKSGGSYWGRIDKRYPP